MSSDPAPPPEADMPPPPARGLMRRILPKLVLSIALGALFAWLAERGGVPILPGREAFESVAWWTIPAYTGCLLVTHTLRATRWRFLVRPIQEVPLKEVIALNWIGFFAIFALPLRLGEMARPALTKLRHGISVSAGFGTIAVERVMSPSITSLCVAWALFALPRVGSEDRLVQALPFYGYLALTVFGGAFLALGLFLWQRSLAVRLTEWGFGLISKRLGKLIAEKVDGVADGIRSLSSLTLTGGFLIESLLYWGTNALGMWLLAYGCGLPLTFGHAIAVMGVLAIGILLPTGPGLFGNFQLAISVALKMYFAEALIGDAGAVYIFLMYVIQAAVMVVTGVVPLYVMHLRLGDLLGAEAIKQGLQSKGGEPA
jgi:hypothetical protein